MSAFSKEKVIHIPSKNEGLKEVEKLVEEVCEDETVNHDFYGNMLIALTEAVNNAIKHGNKEDANKDVDVVFRKNDEEILFVVKDQGFGFDFNDVPDPTTPENIEKPNGRGIFLMKNLADSVEFFDEGSRVELKFDLAKPMGI